MENTWTGRLIKGGLTCLALVAAFYLGGIIGQPAGKAQTSMIVNDGVNTDFRPVVESKIIEITKTVVIEKPVKVIEYIEKDRSPVGLRDFGSQAELRQWLSEQGKNTTTLYFQSPGEMIDCDDYALRLQQAAVSAGYLMSLQIIETDRYNALFKNSRLPPGGCHAINLVVIGNDAFYVEPQTLEVVFAAQLD
jgi:hypothetical protein